MAEESKKPAPAIDKATGAELVTDAELAAQKQSKEAAAAVNERPVRAGKYVVAAHTSVRTLDHLLKPGEPFTGAVGDIPGLLAAGALELVEE